MLLPGAWKLQSNNMALERLDMNTCEGKLQVVLHRARYDFAFRYLQFDDTLLENGAGVRASRKNLARDAQVTPADIEEVNR
jgi:hypothetical protein